MCGMAGLQCAEWQRALTIPRTVDAQLERLLRAAGAVVVEGPKACGKRAPGAPAKSSQRESAL
jgi:hypothetical protein